MRHILRVALVSLAFAGGAGLCSGQDEYERGWSASHSAVAEAARVDINHASLADLMKVPGMKAPWAERIVRFRPYRSKQDLVDQGIVPGVVYGRIRDYIIAHREKTNGS